MTSKEIEEAALKLPLEEREELATKLMASVIHDTPANPEIERAWAEEAERRLKAYREGRCESFPADEAIRDLRKKLK